jgi:flagellar biogenesis protein FliO
MTTRRRRTVGRLTVGLGLGLLLGARVALAEEAIAETTTEAPAPVAVAPAQAPDASVATASLARPWLRAAGKPMQAAIAPAPEPSSPWRALGVLFVLGTLGGAAFVARKKRVTRPGLPESATRVRVLSSARIGPKANAVVAEVGGRVLLLGVTDTSVARLAWLDRDDPGKDTARKPGPEHDARPVAEARVQRPMLSREPVETAEVDIEPPPERGMAARFGEVLDRALGVKPPTSQRNTFRGNPGVAALLAAGVEDVVEARGTLPRTTARMGTGSGSMIVVEDQVAGLKRPRRR